MSNYGVNGWSGGGRQSLTYNLRAGQMRGMGRVNLFPSNTTIINNNIFGNSCGMYDNCCDGSDGMSGFTKTMFGIGMGTSILGTILGFFGIGGGGGKSEGAGGTETPKETKEVKASNEKQDEFAGLKVLYPDGKFAKIGDKYRCNIGDQSFEADSIVDLDKQLKAALNKKPETVKPETDTSSVKPSEPETTGVKTGDNISAIDLALGDKSKIQGKAQVDKTTGDITIPDKTNTYKYHNTGKMLTYKGEKYPIYELAGITNTSTGKTVSKTNQTYILMNGQLVQPNDLEDPNALKGVGTGSVNNSAPPPDETPTVKGAKTSKATSKKSNSEGAGGVKQQAKTQNTQPKQTNKAQAEVDNWNKQHPQSKVTLKNGKYSTVVSSNLGKHEVTANSFDELKTKVYAHLKRANAPHSTNYSVKTSDYKAPFGR